MTTALPYAPTGTAYIYLPVGVVTAGSQGTGAGLYSVTYSSTTVCQLTGTGIVTANAAYTQTTAADLVLATVTVPGGSMGANGRLIVYASVGQPNNANAKLWKTKIGATTLNSTSNTTSVTDDRPIIFRNKGSQSVNWHSGFIGYSQGGATFGHAQTAIDMSVDQTLTITGQLAVATDYLMLESYSIDITYFA
jgi:hypothetical protein